MGGIARIPPPDAEQQQHGSLDLHEPASRNETERVKSLLDSAGANLLDLLKAGTVDDKFTALHLAGGQGHLAVVELILKTIIHSELSKEDIKSVINAKDNENRNPLHYAVGRESWAVVKAFLSLDWKGVIDVNTRDKNGFTPLLSLLKLQGGKLVHVESLAALLNHPEIDVSDVDVTNDVSSSSQQQTGGIIRPLELIVGVQKDSLEVLDSVWDLLNNWNVEKRIVEEIIAQIKSILPTGLQTVVDQTGSTVMHYAAFAGLPALMGILIRKPKYVHDINEENAIAQTPLHLASLRGDLATVKFLDRQPTLQGAREDKDLHTAVEMAFELERSEILRVLLQRSDVKDYIGIQHSDRSVYVDGTNALLVGAALIASITFAGWLQPPLGYQPYFQYSRPDSPPGTYEQYAAITEHTSVKVFWLFNSLSFYFSIASILTGAGAMVPRGDLFVRAEVKRLRGALFLTSFVFSWSVLFVVGAFTASGFASLPPIANYELFMIVTLVLGFFICYFTFSFSRTSDPYFYIRYTKHVDPGFLFSMSLRWFMCSRPRGYDSVRQRVRERKALYKTF